MKVNLHVHTNYFDGTKTVSKVNKLALENNIDAIEVYHPNQSDEFSEELLKLAHKNHLIITAGSDYHGEIIPNKFNESLLYGNYLDEFLKALNKLS